MATALRIQVQGTHTMVSTQIHASRMGEIVVVAVDGPIRAGDSELAFVEVMQGILDGGELNVVIDLSSVPHVDSTGLGRLLQAICRFERAGGTLKLLRPSNYVRNLLAITKVVAMVPVVESIDEGLPDRAGVACYGPA